MRTDYNWCPPEPPTDAATWFTKYSEPGVTLDSILQSGDAPPFVLKYIEERLAHREQWEAGAKDRPYTFDHSTGMPRRRLFDGGWISSSIGNPTLPSVIEATFEIDGGLTLKKCAAVWDVYEKAIEKGDEEACRRIAGAIYEWLEIRGGVDRMLVAAVLEMDAKLGE